MTDFASYGPGAVSHSPLSPGAVSWRIGAIRGSWPPFARVDVDVGTRQPPCRRSHHLPGLERGEGDVELLISEPVQLSAVCDLSSCPNSLGKLTEHAVNRPAQAIT